MAELSIRLKSETEDLHREVEKLPLTRGLIQATEGRISDQNFRDYLFHREVYVSCLEDLLNKEWGKASVTEGSEHLKKVYEFCKKIFRSEVTKKSGEYLDNTFETQTPLKKALPQEVLDYCAHLETLTGEDAKYLFAHAYVNLLDGLFGGALLAKKVEKHWGEEAGAFLRYPNEVLSRELSLRESFPVAKKMVQTQFKDPLDAHSWDENEQGRMVEEARKAFQAVGASFRAILPPEQDSFTFSPGV